jgi:hypothetical protein
MPATRSAGSWLVCGRDDCFLAYAPPGVVIDDSRDDDLSRWRQARWRDTTQLTRGASPLTLRTCTVAEVSASVPGDFVRWIREATLDQIQTLTWFIASAPGERLDRHTRVAQKTHDRLVAELCALDERTPSESLGR